VKLSNLANTPIEERYPDNWPPVEYFVHESRLESAVVEGFRTLVENSEGERQIDSYLTKHPVLLTSVLDLKNTGHHAAWVVPKKAIRPQAEQNSRIEDTHKLVPTVLPSGNQPVSMPIERKAANFPWFPRHHGAFPPFRR